MTNNGKQTEPGVDILGLVKVLSGWVDVPEWAHTSVFRAYYWFAFWSTQVMMEGLRSEMADTLEAWTPAPDGAWLKRDDGDQAPGVSA